MGDGDSIIQNVMVPVGLESEADVRDYVHFGAGYYYAPDGAAFVRPGGPMTGYDDDTSSVGTGDIPVARFARRAADTGTSYGSSCGGSAFGQSLADDERAWLEEQVRAKPPKP